VLASGSKGNSIYLATERVQLLIDAGLSAREIERRLLNINASPKDLDGIVVTHEHVDHVRSIGPFSRRYHLPIYLNKQTYSHLPEAVGHLPEKEEFAAGRSFSVGDITLHPFSISHDAADPVGLTLMNESVKIGVCTDLGAATHLVHRHLEQCSVLILEANYDLEMLKHGPYPWSVKQRIKSRLGHLSNQQSGEVLRQVFNEGLREVILAHISETNNCAELVLNTFIGMLDGHMRERLKITLASQCQPLDLVEL
jgi:phosphoribosyl 1,2-cyclic phosphodiesterase